MPEWTGYILAITIGTSLSLIGGGGSILALPVLVYFFKVPPLLATTYSIFIVGVTSLVGVFSKYKNGEVSLDVGIRFAIPSLIAVYFTRAYLLPFIPQNIAELGDYQLVKDDLIMIVVSIMMIMSGLTMIDLKSDKKDTSPSSSELEGSDGCEQVNSKGQLPASSVNKGKIIIDGLTVGVLTGLIGAGGGFMIIPALVLLSKVPMKMAVGTSMLVITLKSLVGFIGDLSVVDNIDYPFLLLFTFFAFLGIFLGNKISNHTSEYHLKNGFGILLIVVSLYITINVFIIGG